MSQKKDKLGEPSLRQVAEMNHIFSQWADNWLKGSVQQWVGKATMGIELGGVINLGPWLLQRILSKYVPDYDDLVFYKSMLLGKSRLDWEKRRPAGATGINFAGLSFKDYKKAFAALGVCLEGGNTEGTLSSYEKKDLSENKFTFLPINNLPLFKFKVNEYQGFYSIDLFRENCLTGNNFFSLEQALNCLLDLVVFKLLNKGFYNTNFYPIKSITEKQVCILCNNALMDCADKGKIYLCLKLIPGPYHRRGKIVLDRMRIDTDITEDMGVLSE